MPPARKRRASEPGAVPNTPRVASALPSDLITEAHELLPPDAFWSLLQPFLPELDLLPLPLPVIASIDATFGAPIWVQTTKQKGRKRSRR